MAFAHGLSIGALADRSGTNAPTIRYYEEIGLLRPPDRGAGGHRVYGEDDIRRLTFVRRCREFGFPIDQVRTLAALIEDSDRSCLEVRDLASEHLASVRSKLAELKALEKSLAAFAKECETACTGGPGPECLVLDQLSRPRKARPHRLPAVRSNSAARRKVRR